MQRLYEDLYNRVVTAVLEIEPVLVEFAARNPTSVPDMADKLFAIRECIKRLKELMRDLSAKEEIIEKLFVAIYLASSQSDLKVKTEYVSAEPIPKLGTRIPRKHEPEYEEFMTFLGIPKEVQQHEVVIPHFPGWCSYYTSLQAQGKDVPDGIKTALTEYEMSIVQTRKLQSMKGSFHVEGND